MITKFTVSENTTMFGLSTDTKPTGADVVNGSVFIEMNTGKIYFYSKTDTTWYEWGD